MRAFERVWGGAILPMPAALGSFRHPSLVHARRAIHCGPPLVLLRIAEERTASVALIYERDGQQTAFKRSISPAGVGEYRVDGRVVKCAAVSAFARRPLFCHVRHTKLTDCQPGCLRTPLDTEPTSTSPASRRSAFTPRYAAVCPPARAGGGWGVYACRVTCDVHMLVDRQAHLGFLVFQGYVSELASKSPAELTALFEQISGSEDLKVHASGARMVS